MKNNANKSGKDNLKEKANEAKEKIDGTKTQAKSNLHSVKEEFEEISEVGKNPEFWESIREEATENARIATEEAKDFAAKVASYSENIYGVIREKAEDVFAYGTNLTRDAVNYAQKVSDKYRDRAEISKLNAQKKVTASQLGMYIYLAYKNNENSVPRQTFAQKKVKSVLKDLEEIDEKILKLSEEME